MAPRPPRQQLPPAISELFSRPDVAALWVEPGSVRVGARVGAGAHATVRAASLWPGAQKEGAGSAGSGGRRLVAKCLDRVGPERLGQVRRR